MTKRNKICIRMTKRNKIRIRMTKRNKIRIGMTKGFGICFFKGSVVDSDPEHFHGSGSKNERAD